MNHAENGTVENVFYCNGCEIYEKKTRRRELQASLIMARHLKSLKHIGWSTCFFWDSSTTTLEAGKNDDESVIEEVAENKLDDAASAMKTSSLNKWHAEQRHPNVGLTTELFITKTSIRTTVQRVV
jgi:hypothetical protein